MSFTFVRVKLIALTNTYFGARFLSTTAVKLSVFDPNQWCDPIVSIEQVFKFTNFEYDSWGSVLLNVFYCLEFFGFVINRVPGQILKSIFDEIPSLGTSLEFIFDHFI